MSNVCARSTRSQYLENLLAAQLPVVGDGEGCGGSPVAVSSTVMGGGGSDLERLRLFIIAAEC